MVRQHSSAALQQRDAVRMRRRLAALSAVLALALAACAAPSQPAPSGTRAPTGGQAENQEPTGSRVGDAATTPLNDLNLVRATIPSILIDAQKSPYARPLQAGCDAVAAEVQALDAVLGPDLDVPPSPTNPGLVERGGGVAGDAAVDALRGAAEGLVPFRGWVRRLTGAERHSREVAAAIVAGTVRRAFLKGLGDAQACAVPASPHRDVATR